MLPTFYKDRGECGWWFHLFYLNNWWCWSPPGFLVNGKQCWLNNFTRSCAPMGKESNPFEFLVLTGHVFKLPEVQ
jgi:hypothetical protein